MNKIELMDLFASRAMTELLKHDLERPIEKQMGYEWVAKYSYVIAHTMMEAKNAYYASKTS